MTGDAPRSLAALAETVGACRACPRLVAWREQVARVRVARFRSQAYWGRPVAGFGDPEARLLVVGLAPGAHGANRTGRVFTGDRSGDFLYAALHRAGLASQPESRAMGDGLVLRDTFVTCAVRCAPPGNAPSPDERAQCAPFLEAEAALLPRVRAVLALGAFAWDAWIRLARPGERTARPKFAHGARVELPSATLLGSYHVSQQNTQTGRLTEAMFDATLGDAMRAAGLERPSLRVRSR